MGKVEKVLVSLVFVAFFGGLILLPLHFWQPAQAAAPLPAGPVQVFTLNTAPVAATTTFTPAATGGRWNALGTAVPSTEAEVWLFVDVTTVNTSSFGLQVSADGTIWTDHATAGTLAANVVADLNQYTALTIRGVFYRVVMTATNSNTLTPTIKVVLR